MQLHLWFCKWSIISYSILFVCFANFLHILSTSGLDMCVQFVISFSVLYVVIDIHQELWLKQKIQGARKYLLQLSLELIRRSLKLLMWPQSYDESLDDTSIHYHSVLLLNIVVLWTIHNKFCTFLSWKDLSQELQYAHWLKAVLPLKYTSSTA